MGPRIALSYPIIDDVSRAGGRVVRTFVGGVTFAAAGARLFAGSVPGAVPAVVVAGFAMLSGGWTTVAGVDEAAVAASESALDCPAGVQPIGIQTAKPMARQLAIEARLIFIVRVVPGIPLQVLREA